MGGLTQWGVNPSTCRYKYSVFAQTLCLLNRQPHSSIPSSYLSCNISFNSFSLLLSLSLPLSFFLILTSYHFLSFFSTPVNASMDALKRSVAVLSHPATTDEDLETLLKSEDGGALFSSKYAFPTTSSRLIKKIVVAVLPTPIQRRLAPHLYKPSRIHSTSYLDGLRGMCILFLSSPSSSLSH